MADAVLWGVRLSPFYLKLEACLQFSDHPYRRLPAQGSRVENFKYISRLEQAKRNHSVKRYPQRSPEFDEYPAVPFFSDEANGIQYDSSSIAHWLDDQRASGSRAPALNPSAPALSFLNHLIDEAFDEFGLYMVHHMRWVGSAKTQVMGKLLAQEFKTALPPGGGAILAKSFPRRQVRRCPYLFSVAPKGYQAGVTRALTPPSRDGFPETHSLLNQCWKRYLKDLDAVLQQQPYILGERFTLADASAYGQLAMNLVDKEAADRLLTLAPTTFNWLKKIEHGQHKPNPLKETELLINPVLKGLLNTIMGTFSALMVQNEKAYQLALEQGESSFNEAAFNTGKSLYDGQLLGYPFRSVVKTFQVRVWREIKAHWQSLPPTSQQELRALIDVCELFD